MPLPIRTVLKSAIFAPVTCWIRFWGIRGGEIDPNKYEWIGNMASDTDLCSFWYTSGVHSFEDLKNKQVIVGASGTGSHDYTFPNAINYILHTQMKIILGYKGIADRIFATERGEFQGNCGITASSILSQVSATSRRWKTHSNCSERAPPIPGAAQRSSHPVICHDRQPKTHPHGYLQSDGHRARLCGTSGNSEGPGRRFYARPSCRR